MSNYDEQEVLTTQAAVRAAYVAAGRPLNPFDDASVVWSNRTTADAISSMTWPASRAKHIAELVAELGGGPTPPGPLPVPPPTRDAILGIKIGFQGITVLTQQYGSFPAFGPETTTLNDTDLDSYVDQMVAAGNTHVEIAISWNYNEADFAYPVPGRDLTQNLPELKRRITRMLGRPGVVGVLLFMAGDGRSAPRNPDGSYPYNDPQGWTYGHEWLMTNFARVAAALNDIRKYIIVVPGYDGVFYGWGNSGEPDLQPQRVVDFGNLFRSLWPDGYLGLEHSTGHIPVGEGGSDYAGRLQPYDVILSEFDNWPATGDPTWQIAGRLVHPYHRPADQPSGDDPNPPFYLAPGTPRGPYYACAYEFATYQWVRGRISAADVQRGRDYYKALGYAFTG
jgi:hypothetical protein